MEGHEGGIRWENVRQEEGEIYFFIIYLQCFPLKGWRPKRWKPIFMCVWPSSILNFLYII